MITMSPGASRPFWYIALINPSLLGRSSSRRMGSTAKQRGRNCERRRGDHRRETKSGEAGFLSLDSCLLTLDIRFSDPCFLIHDSYVCFTAFTKTRKRTLTRGIEHSRAAYNTPTVCDEHCYILNLVRPQSLLAAISWVYNGPLAREPSS